MAGKSHQGNSADSGLDFDPSSVLKMLSSPEFKVTLSRVHEGAVSALKVIHTLSETETVKKLQKLSAASESIANASRDLDMTVSRLKREGKLASAAGRLESASVFIDCSITNPSIGEREVGESICLAATDVVRAMAAVMGELAMLLREIRAR